MKKQISFILSLLLIAALLLPAAAAPEGPVITLQPQSIYYPTYSTALYTVKADGSNLSATWYMTWEGDTYNISKLDGSMQPWEVYAGENYGPNQPDSHTFTYLFGGIENELSGAEIWCVIEDGHNDVTSRKAIIGVGDYGTPPQIAALPAALTVEQGAAAELRCIATAPDGTQLSFLWYETDSGKLQDMRAVNRGEETADTLICNTSTPGTRNYLCLVTTSQGGIAYSSTVAVTVTEKAAVPEPQIQTATLPAATAGQAYSAKLLCSDPKAEFVVYYNPGRANDFEKTGLTLSKDGAITGTPKEAGSYSFTVCAAGEGGECYQTYTLTVNKPVQPEPTAPATKPSAAPDPTDATQKPTEPSAPTQIPQQAGQDLPWWVLALVAVAALGLGVGVALILTRKH